MCFVFKNKFIDLISKKLRSSKLEPIRQKLQSGAVVLDIGVWCSIPEPHPGENWLEKQNYGKGKLIAVGLENMQHFKKKYPHVLCVQANGCALPFADNSIDVAFANAVLEHVPEAEQQDFVNEISRVTKKFSMLAVPDRFSPLEVHSRIPFLHWLPFWRNLYRLMGEQYWSSPINLSTIFTKRSFSRLLQKTQLDEGEWMVKRQKIYAIPISLIGEYYRIQNHE